MSTREDWQRRLGPLYGGAVALVHSTPWRWPIEVQDDARSPVWIVALGVPIGLVAWAIAALVHAAGLAPSIAALFGLAMLSVASAALIERGVGEQIERWEGRSQSAVATLTISLTVLVRAAAMTTMPPSRWLVVLLATAVVGRWAAVFLQALGDPIDHDDERRSLVAKPAQAWLVGAISLAVTVITVLAIGKAGIVALALTALVAFGLGISAQRTEGGLTAPVVAVTAAIGELLVLLVASLGHA